MDIFRIKIGPIKRKSTSFISCYINVSLSSLLFIPHDFNPLLYNPNKIL